MKQILFIFILMSFVFSALAEGPVVDPTITPIWTVTCNYPIEREDGTPLAISEIARVEFKVSQDKTTWQPAGQNTTECKQIYDLSAVPDGQYYYTPMTVDTAGRQSVLAYDADPGEVSALVVKRIANPNHPTGVQGAAS